MDAHTNAIFGVLFLALAFAAVLLMFRIWGYPFDEQRRASTAPRSLVRLHRLVGVCYVLLYLLMMSQMVPRLFHYQVEFPARSVAHLMLGVSIGVLLFLKLVILRSCRHFSAWLPYIGVGILWCTTMVVSLSVPFAFKERYWSRTAVGGSAFSPENLERVRRLVPTAGLPDDAPLSGLSEVESLRAGRRILLSQCVTCHDLKTILTRPRTPSDWFLTVERMAERQIFEPIEEPDQWAVAAYLIAISPELQSSAKRRHRDQVRAAESLQAVQAVMTEAEGAPATHDLQAARALFEQTCSQCHEPTEVEKYPLHSDQDVRQLLTRMAGNGLDASEADLEVIAWYLAMTYIR